MKRRFRDRRRASIKFGLLSLEGRNPVTPIGAAAVIGASVLKGACVVVGGVNG